MRCRKGVEHFGATRMQANKVLKCTPMRCRKALSTTRTRTSGRTRNVNSYEMPKGVEHDEVAFFRADCGKATSYEMPKGVEHIVFQLITFACAAWVPMGCRKALSTIGRSTPRRRSTVNSYEMPKGVEHQGGVADIYCTTVLTPMGRARVGRLPSAHAAPHLMSPR